MESFGVGIAGLGAAGVATIGAFKLAFRQQRRRRQSRGQQLAGPAPRGEAERLEALGQAQAELALRLDALAAEAHAPEERLQAMAGQLLGLIRDKNATLETALAGLDQLRARMRTLEQMGEPAEARALLETLRGRLDELAQAQAAASAALEARLATLAEPSADRFGAAELAERLARLQESRDAGAEAFLARLGPLEAKLAELAGGREALKRLDGRLEALAAEQGAARAELAGLKAEAGAGRGLAEGLARLHAQKEALAELLLDRIGALEAAVAAQDPQAALDRLAALETPGESPFAEISEQLTRLYAQKDATVETVFARLAPLEARLAELAGLPARIEALEAPGESPFAEISEQLTRLYAQKDATVQTVFARLAPLEAKLAEVEGRDPRGALDRFAARLEGFGDRLAAIEDNPFAELSERLTSLYAQKDAAVETVFARLAPLEARLAELEGRDPRGALDGFAARLAALEAPGESPFAEISEQLTRLYAQKDATVETVFARLAPLEARLAELEGRDPREALAGFAARLAALEAPGESPFAEISEQLTRLYAQKDATVETVFARLAPLEAKLAELEGRDPRGALDRFASRLEGFGDRLAAIEDNPFAELSERLTSLYAQKDATVETVFTRLAPLEARLTELEGGDPRGALDRFAARLEGFGDRLSAIEDNPFAELSERLASLYAQKDATLESVFVRLAPLEAKLAELEGKLRPLTDDDPRAAVEGLRLRLEALAWAQSEVAGGLAALQAAAAEGGGFAEVADQLTRLFAQKDASAATLLARLAPLEARLAGLEAGPRDPEAAAARAEAAALGERLARLEADLPRAAAAAKAPAELEAIWSMPRIVSLHRKPS